MKFTLLAVGAALFLSGCAGQRVVSTQVATGALNPKYIYIRPFTVGPNAFKGSHRGAAQRELLKSQAPIDFATILKHELDKLAPTWVLADDETPQIGWLVEGEIDLVDAGLPAVRALAVPFRHIGFGRSVMLTHVRVRELGRNASTGDKNGRRSNVIYEFDVAGSSRAAGSWGSVRSSGIGYAPPFDYRNTAERISIALNPGADHYGIRSVAPFN